MIGRHSGLQGCVRAMRGDDIVYDYCGGFADRSADRACTPETRFQLASVSKQFTALTIMLLIERGVVRLDDRVSRWLPECPRSWGEITVHHLLCHSSGLGHWDDYPEIDLATRPPNDLIGQFQQRSPYHRPGAAFRYSSPGYVVLAEVVQRAADCQYADFLAAQILSPLGLSSTFVGSPGEREVAVGYTGAAVAPSFEMDVVARGAGDVSSTVGDVLRCDDALRDGKFLNAQSRALMFRPQIPCADWPETGYGYGWFIGPLAGRPAVYHTGHNAGFQCLQAWFRDADLRVVLLSNHDDGDGALVGQALSEVVEEHITDSP